MLILGLQIDKLNRVFFNEELEVVAQNFRTFLYCKTVSIKYLIGTVLYRKTSYIRSSGSGVVQSKGRFLTCITCIVLIVGAIRSPVAIGAPQNIITSYGTIAYSPISKGLPKTITWADGQMEAIDIHGASIELNGKSYPFVSWAFHWLPVSNWAGNSISGLQTVLPQLSVIGIRAVKLYIPGDDLPSSGVNYNMLGQALDLLYQNKMWIYIIQDNQGRSNWTIDKQSLYATPAVIDFVCQKSTWANMVFAWSPENELEDWMATNNFTWTSNQLRIHVTWVHDALKAYLSQSAIGDIPVTFPMCAGYQIDPNSGENNCKILVDASDIPDFHCYRKSLADLNASIDGWYAYSNPTRRGWWSGECNWHRDVIAAKGGICSWEYIQTMLTKNCSAIFIYALEQGINPDGSPTYPGTVVMLDAIRSFYNS